MSFTIITDTSANLPTDFIRRERIEILPYSYTLRGKDQRVTLELDRFQGDKFYDAMRKGMSVTTSLISPKSYAERFEAVLARGEDAIFISMSSGISNSFRCAQLAAEEVLARYPDRRLWLIDTLGASLGEGLLVLRAVERRRQGVPAEETAAELQELRHRVCQVFTVDDLQYLRKGGRLSNMAAFVGTVLNIKPLLKGNEQGKIVAFGKVRGRKKSIDALAARYDLLVERPEEQTVGIAQAGCPQDAAELAEKLRKNRPPREILIVDYEPVTGSHVGPGALALFFLGRGDVRTACS